MQNKRSFCIVILKYCSFCLPRYTYCTQFLYLLSFISFKSATIFTDYSIEANVQNQVLPQKVKVSFQ